MKIELVNCGVSFTPKTAAKEFELTDAHIDIPLSGSLSVGDPYDIYIKVDSMSSISTIRASLGSGKMSIDTLSDFVEEGDKIKEGGKWYHYKGTFYHATPTTQVSTLRVFSQSGDAPASPIIIYVKPVDFFG